MIYLEQFVFPGITQEENFCSNIKLTCYNTVYPFGVLSSHGFRQIKFAPVTILCGGNGCGKSTALNVIAEKFGAQRDALNNRSNFFGDYVRLCRKKINPAARPAEVRFIASDAVFDYMLDVRAINEGIDSKRKDMADEYISYKYGGRGGKRQEFRLRSLADYDQLCRTAAIQRKKSTMSGYVRSFLPDNVREQSNGESGFAYFTQRIGDNGLYLLDEPENSLSPQRQLELVEFLQNAVRFFGCQLVIATHSPLLLSMQGAQIYDLDETPVRVRKWTEIESVRVLRDFFRAHESEF